MAADLDQERRWQDLREDVDRADSEGRRSLLIDAAQGTRRGRFQCLRSGDDVTLIAAGTLVSQAVAGAEELFTAGISARVLNAAYLSPLDTAAIEDATRGTRAVVTAEEANLAGGPGAAVTMVVAGRERSARVPVRSLGLTEFAPVGSTDLLEYFGLTTAGIVSAAHDALALA